MLILKRNFRFINHSFKGRECVNTLEVSFASHFYPLVFQPHSKHLQHFISVVHRMR